jgi:hypothetical protein
VSTRIWEGYRKSSVQVSLEKPDIAKSAIRDQASFGCYDSISTCGVLDPFSITRSGTYRHPVHLLTTQIMFNTALLAAAEQLAAGVTISPRPSTGSELCLRTFQLRLVQARCAQGSSERESYNH